MSDILVFGRSGQVARALSSCLHIAGPARFLRRDEVDLARPDAVREAVLDAKPRLVINAAAWTAVDAAEDHEAGATTINADSPAAMATATARLNVPLIHYSTDYVFDGSGNTAIKPDAPTGPLSAYGRSKLAGEAAVRAATRRHLILRTSWVYDAAGKNFLNTMLRLGSERDHLRVVDDQIGAPTSADVIATTTAAIARDILHHGADYAGTHHLVCAGQTSWCGFARRIFELARPPEGRNWPTVEAITTQDYPTPAPRPANSRLDTASLTAMTAIAPVPWQDALVACLRAKGLARD